MSALYDRLKSLKADTDDESNGRHIIPEIAAAFCRNRSARILDVGAGWGKDLAGIRMRLPNAKLFALETFPLAAEHLKTTGIEVASINLERDQIPFPDQSFDLVVCNQVLEHVKEVFWVVSEMARVLKVGGHLAIGVPNLASFHNRIALLFGRHPTNMRVFGPHVRGFTSGDMRAFLEKENILKVRSVVGGNFYPFSPRLSRPLARLMPGLAVSSFFIAEKIRGDGAFLDILGKPEAGFLVDTPYYRGEQFSAAAT